MFLNIPISNLLDSLLEIGIDPLSGNFFYQIKDNPSRLKHSDDTGDLVLTLQSSPWDGCLRICTNSTTDPAHQVTDISKLRTLGTEEHQSTLSAALDFTSGLPVLAGQHDQNCAYSADSEMSARSSPDVQDQGFFGLLTGYQDTDSVASYNLQTDESGSPEHVMDLAPLLGASQEHSSQLPESQGSSLVAPVWETTPLITSDLFEVTDTTSHELLDFSGYGDCYHDTSLLHVHPINNPETDPAHFYPAESSSSVIDRQAFQDGGEASASCTSFPITIPSGTCPPIQDSHSPLPRRSWASAGVLNDQSPGSKAEGGGDSQKTSKRTVSFTSSLPGNSTSRPDSRVQPRSDRDKGYPCPHTSCRRILKNLYTQQLHMKSHMEKPRKTFLCTMGCSESFTRHHDRLRHEVSQHGKQCEFVCRRCDRFFSSQRMLDRHTCWSSWNGMLRWQMKDCADSHREA